jgi:signal peptidase I
MLYQPGNRAPMLVNRFFSWRQFAHEWVRPILTVILIGLVINLFFPRYYVQGHSMEPQLHESDWLFTSNIDALTQSFARGNIVVLVSPHDGQLAVKRVIGLPGEVVEVRDGRVYIDQMPLIEDYINEPPRYTGRWQVGPGQYFVLGDNRNHSLDSSDYGPVDAQRIRGSVKFRLWPPTDFGLLGVPTYTGRAPE